MCIFSIASGIYQSHGGAIHSYNTDFDRMLTSNDKQVKFTLYETYIPEQDVFSALWLMNQINETRQVYADYESGTHVLFSYGLIPNNLILPLTNNTFMVKDNFLYLGSANVVNGFIITSYGSFKTSEISTILDSNNIVYSNGNSEICYAQS